MVLSIKDEKTDELARKLASLTGESITETIFKSLQERYERLKSQHRDHILADELDAIALRCAKLPVIDARTEEEIIGYDDYGMPQ